MWASNTTVKDTIKFLVLIQFMFSLFFLVDMNSISTYSQNNCPVKIGSISDIPSSPIPVSPNDGSHIEDTTPTFEWTESVGTTSYELQIDNNTNFSSDNLLTVENITSTTYTLTSELAHGRWYWRVRAINASGESEFSAMMEIVLIPSRTDSSNDAILIVFASVAVILGFVALLYVIMRYRGASTK